MHASSWGGCQLSVVFDLRILLDSTSDISDGDNNTSCRLPGTKRALRIHFRVIKSAYVTLLSCVYVMLKVLGLMYSSARCQLSVFALRILLVNGGNKLRPSV